MTDGSNDIRHYLPSQQDIFHRKIVIKILGYKFQKEHIQIGNLLQVRYEKMPIVGFCNITFEGLLIFTLRYVKES